MQSRILSLLLLLSPLIPSAHALDFVWPGHGTISIDAPKSWTVVAKQTGDMSYYFNVRAKTGVAALAQITLIEAQPDHPVRMEQLTEELKTIVQPMLESSVEKKFAPQEIHLKQGKGWYVQLTDTNLVGKPPVPDDYKVMRNALLGLDDHALVVVTMQFDDPQGKEPEEMLRFVSSMRFTRGTKGGQLAQTQVAGAFVFTVPESKLRLSIPGNGLVPDTDRIGGSTNNPRYFKLSRTTQSPPQALVLSGWFEPSFRFKGDLKKFWAGETEAWKKNGQSAPVNVDFLKSDNWDVIAYDMPFPEGTNCHLRAELTQAGTWIDLHFSLTSQQTAAEARAQLLAVLKSIQVTKK